MATPKKTAGAKGEAPEENENIQKLEAARGSIDPRGTNAEALRLVVEVLLDERNPNSAEPGGE